MRPRTTPSLDAPRPPFYPGAFGKGRCPALSSTSESDEERKANTKLPRASETTPAHPRGVGRPKTPVPREELLTAARDAFAVGGFAGTSMNDIAQRAGVRKASLFYHFADKETLYAEVMDRVVASLRGYVGGALTAPGGFAERLDRLGELVVEYLGVHAGAARLLVREMVDLGAYAAGPGRAAIARTLDEIAAFLESGMRAGAFRPRDPRQLALSIVGLHLFYFAAEELSGPFVGAPVRAPEALAARRQAAVDQVRALVVA